jgi:cytochrome c6
MMVKKLFSLVTLLVAFVALTFATPAMAADLSNGAKVFSANCTACHMGGGNTVNPAKTLKKSDLEKYGMDSMDAITTQVKQGKMAMPSFIGRLSSKDIEDVAAYILDKAEKGW